MKKGKTFIISGPSGVGKGSVLKVLLERRKDVYVSVSATTRQPRAGEENGVHYHFLDVDTFHEWIAQDAFQLFLQVAHGFPSLPGALALFEIFFHFLDQPDPLGVFHELADGGGQLGAVPLGGPLGGGLQVPGAPAEHGKNLLGLRGVPQLFQPARILHEAGGLLPLEQFVKIRHR